MGLSVGRGSAPFLGPRPSRGRRWNARLGSRPRPGSGAGAGWRLRPGGGCLTPRPCRETYLLPIGRCGRNADTVAASDTSVWRFAGLTVRRAATRDPRARTRRTPPLLATRAHALAGQRNRHSRGSLQQALEHPAKCRSAATSAAPRRSAGFLSVRSGDHWRMTLSPFEGRATVALRALRCLSYGRRNMVPLGGTAGLGTRFLVCARHGRGALDGSMQRGKGELEDRGDQSEDKPGPTLPIQPTQDAGAQMPASSTEQSAHPTARARSGSSAPHCPRLGGRLIACNRI